MATSVEVRLLSKVILTNGFQEVLRMKVTSDFFYEAGSKELFHYIHAHYHNRATYGYTPSWEMCQSHFPGYYFDWGAQDSIPSLCFELRERRIKTQIRQSADLLQQAAETPFEALNQLRSMAAQLSSEHTMTDDLLLSECHDKLATEYETVASGQGITGIPYPWDVLNEDTQGMHPGEYIVIYGRPKSMKSWVGLCIGMHAYRYFGQRVLVYSMEMPTIQVLRRCSALLAMIDYKKFRAGKLTPLAKQNLFDSLSHLKAEENSQHTKEGHTAAFMATSDDDENGGGISSLQAKIREFQPDLVIVDGFYLMKDDRSGGKGAEWKNTANISRDLKRTAKNLKVPIIGITQANRLAAKDAKNADLNEISYADAIGQDCDLCMRAQKVIDTTTGLPEIVLGFPGSREGSLDAFVIHGVPATDFTFKRAIQADHAASNQPPPPPPPGTNSSPGPNYGTAASNNGTTVKKRNGAPAPKGRGPIVCGNFRGS